MSDAQQAFCAALKAARERRGITLAEIASATKVSASLFAALERSDLRRWPAGLFRRAYVRDYLRAVGLPVEETFEEFVRLFPDEEFPGGESAGYPVHLRLTIDPSWRPRSSYSPSRIVAAVLDLAALVLVSSAVTWWGNTDAPTTLAVVALTYYALSTALLGTSATAWVISRRTRKADAWSLGAAEATSLAVEDSGGEYQKANLAEVG
jgi:transcriptional regulator with XRE-family HTH domain